MNTALRPLRNQFLNSFVRNRNAVAIPLNNVKRFKRDIPDGAILDKEVERTIEGTNESTIPEFPVWNETLASASEASVKADRSPDKNFHELQEETIEVLEKKTKTHQYPMQ